MDNLSLLFPSYCQMHMLCRKSNTLWYYISPINAKIKYFPESLFDVLLKNDMLRINRVYLCNYKLYVHYLGITIGNTCEIPSEV